MPHPTFDAAATGTYTVEIATQNNLGITAGVGNAIVKCP